MKNIAAANQAFHGHQLAMKTIPIPARWRRAQFEVAKNGQSLDFTEVLIGFNGARIRIRIRSDSYLAQSYAIAEFWDGSRWNEVCRIGTSQMATESGLVYKPPGANAPDWFARDRNQLLGIASEIIGVEAEQLS